MSHAYWFAEKDWSGLHASEPTKMTERDKVLTVLRHKRPVCGTMFLEIHIPTYSQRISELRAEGYDIQRVPCPYENHTHTKKIATYVAR